MNNRHFGLLLIFTTLFFNTGIYLPNSISEDRIPQLLEGENLQQIRSELFLLINQERKNLGMKNLKIKREIEKGQKAPGLLYEIEIALLEAKIRLAKATKKINP